ncbi:MAG TPA: hypothetical protein VLB11_09815, partial [Methyloceanibacter sp.]|nr:hypothetical protein [Methyloceanibacter sp.]
IRARDPENATVPAIGDNAGMASGKTWNALHNCAPATRASSRQIYLLTIGKIEATSRMLGNVAAC